MTKQHLLLAITLIGFSCNAYSMSVFQAAVTTLGATGAVVGAAKYRYDDRINEKYTFGSTPPEPKNYVHFTLSCAAVVALVCLRKTPQGLLFRANRQMNKGNKWLLGKVQTMESSDQFIETVRKGYIQSSYALVAAFKDCNKIFDRSVETQTLLTIALTVENINPETKRKCQTLLTQLQDEKYWKNLERAMLALKENDKFLKQMNAQSLKYAADAAEQNTTAQRQNANANTMSAAANMFRRR